MESTVCEVVSRSGARTLKKKKKLFPVRTLYARLWSREQMPNASRKGKGFVSH